MDTSNKIHVTYLGPTGATFSDEAYHKLARLYCAPMGENAVYQPASTNADVVGAVIGHGGFGAIAMETLAQGRVSEPLEAFVELIGRYENILCPLSVIGALKMQLHFCLMVRRGVSREQVSGIVAHPKSLGACKENVARLGLTIREVSSNGEAARLVAEDDEYATWAALGPESAAKKYDLEIVETAFEDSVAVTTFFLLGPQGVSVVTGKQNRALIVFRTNHTPGALVDALMPWKTYGLNLIQIHSVYVANGVYDFAIEIDMNQDQISSFYQALGMFTGAVKKHITFGPFPVA